MNNEQTPSTSDTPADRVGSGGAAAKLPTIIPDTPIVSIAAGTMSESTTTTTATKTTPTPFPQDQLMTLMSDHVAKVDAHLDEPSRKQGAKDDDSQGAAAVAANHVATSGSNSKAGDPKKSLSPSNSHTTGNHAATAEATKGSTATGDSPFSQVFAMLKDSPSAELSRPNRRVLQYGATAKGKTQDDQNVGKRQKKKKTKYDTWEDSDFNDLDDASLKKLLEEAYWYRNPGDRKNKSERFLQMLKKAEYDEEISYRAIKSCLTLNPSPLTSSAATGSSGGSSSSAGHNSSYNSTNHRSTDPGQRHKQGGSLQDLVEAAHRSELATTSAAAAAASAATTAATQRFNCDYQLSGRSNRRQQQHNQNATSSASASKKIKNSNVSGRQREGGSLPSSVNFEPSAAMDAKQHKQLAQPSSEATGEPFAVSVGNKHHQRSTTGSCSSLPSHLDERDPEASTQFDLDVDDATGVGASAVVGVSGVQDDFMLQQTDQSRSMQFLIDALNDKPMEARYNAAGKKFLIDDHLHFSVLELSARRKLQQQAQYLAALTGQFGLGLEEEKRKVESGFVSFNDNYTACSSVYGGGAGSPAAVEGSKPSTSSSASSSGSSYGASSDTMSGDFRPAKIGRVVPAAASVAAAPMGGKTITRQLDENGNALADGFGGSAASGASAVASSSNGNGNQFTALITTTVGSSAPTSSAANRQNSVSTLLSTGANTTTTAMAAAAVAASYSQLQQAPGGGAVGAGSGIGIGLQQPTKQKAKKKSQQERNTTTVDVESVAGYRGNDPVEQLVKYIENDVNGGGNSAAGQRKKERKKQNKLKKSNSLEELRTCSKMEVDDLKRQSATTEMMRQKKGTNNASSGGSSSTASGSSNSGKHNSASVADINKNCNKEQQQQSTPMVQVRNSNNPGSQQRKGERRSWGTEELHYLGDHQEMSAAWSEPETVGQKQLPLALPALARMSELEALNTVLSETAEFHVVTKKKKPKKQRAVTMDDAAVAAAAGTGGNLQRMQQITKSASSNIMSQRMHYYTPYNSNNGGGSANGKQQQQQSQQYQEHYQAQQGQHHHHHHHHHHHSGSAVSNQVDSSRRKSTSSMPPSEKSDSSDLDSVHSLPIQTGKKKSLGGGNNKQRAAQAASQRQAKQNNNSAAPISYADIARNKKEGLNNATASDTELELGDKIQSKCGGKSKSRPDFPELPGAVTTGAASGGAVNQATVASNQTTPPSSSSSISYSQSLNATPPSSSSDAESTNSPELFAQVQIPTYSMATPTLTASTISSVSSSAASTSFTSGSPPALQKSKSVEHETSYSCNSSNLDQQYPALERTVKRHSTNNVSVAVAASTSASSLYNFAAAAKQQLAENAYSAISPPAAVTTTSTAVVVAAPASVPAPVQAPTAVTVPCYSSSSTQGSTQSLSSTASSAIALSSAKAKAKPKELSPSSNCSKKPTKPSHDAPSISLSISTTPKATTSTSTVTTQKTTAATQTEGAKKLISGIYKLPSSSCIAKGAGAVLEANTGRRAVIILNDDREAGRSNNEFIFGDFNEDELKLFDDNLDDEEGQQHKQSSNKKQQTEAESDVCQDDTEDVDQELEKVLECLERRQGKKQEKQQDVSSSSDQHLNDSGAASDAAVNSSASLDMLSISADAAQSSPNAGATATSSSAASLINSSTPSGASSASASTSTSSSSVSISSFSGGNGAACLASVSGMLGGVGNQSGDSGIYAAANTSIKEHVNTFLSKASSSEETLPSPNSISMQQLETCNDIEAAIIAAARAAAAARSTSYTRNSQEQEALQSQVKTKATHNPNPEARVGLPVFMTYNDDDENDESLQELSFMADLTADAATEDISVLPPPPSFPAMMTNTELIVDYIAKTWNAIANSKYVTYYNEMEQDT